MAPGDKRSHTLGTCSPVAGDANRKPSVDQTVWFQFDLGGLGVLRRIPLLKLRNSLYLCFITKESLTNVATVTKGISKKQVPVMLIS